MFRLNGCLFVATFIFVCASGSKSGFVTSCSRETVYVRWELDSKHFPHRIRFRHDIGCRAQAKSDRKAEFKIDLLNLRLCGGSLKRSGKFASYRNEIVYLGIHEGAPLSLYNVTCLFDGRRSIPTLLNNHRKVVEGFGKVEINLYRSPKFSPANSLQDLILLTSVGQFLHVEIKSTLFGFLGNEASFLVERCVATYDPDVTRENTLHGLIDNGCPSANDSTVAVEMDTENSLFRFRFQMFNWLNATMQRIYLFCDVTLCKDGATFCNVTRTQCTRGRQSVNQNPTELTSEKLIRSVRLGFGPIFPIKQPFHAGEVDFGNSSNIDDSLKFARNNENTDYTAVYASVGVVCGVIFVMLLATIFVLVRRSRSGRYHTNAQKKVGKQQGFDFAIRSSNDAPETDDNTPTSIADSEPSS